MVIIYLILFIFSLSVEASDSFSYSGRLVTHAGSPAPGPAKLTFDLIYTSQPSNILCSQTLNEVELSHGVFHVKLDFPTCNLETIFKSTPDNHTVSIRVTDNTSGLNKVYSYQAIHSVPFAFVSQSSKQLDSMNAASGEVLAWNGDKWAPINPSSLVTSTAPEGDAGGALTGTYPNPGLAPISQSNVVNLVSDLTSKIGLSHLSATLPLVYNNATGEFSLDNSAIVKLDELEVLPNGDGLIDRSSGILSARTCDSGEVLKWFAPGGWTCSADSSEDIDKLPLAGGTLTGDLILSTQLQIKNGAAHSIILKTPLSDTNYTLVLPPSAGGTNQVLTTNGGILTWETPATSAAPSGAAGGVLNGTYPNPGLNDIPQSKVTDLVTDLASKIGLNNLSATAPLNYNSGAFSISEATISSAGTLSATDKTKLDGLEPIPNLPGLVERYGTTLRNRSCSPNEVLKWDGSLGWICAIDDDKDETKLPLAGGTLTGPLVLSGSPGADLHATTKLYVDTLVSNNASKWTNITGGIHYSGGNIGIGTATPGTDYVSAKTFHLKSTGRSSLVIEGSDVSYASLVLTSGPQDSTDEWHINTFGTTGDKILNFWNGGNKMSLLQNGNLGIGTSVPSYKIDINGEASSINARIFGSHPDGAVMRFENTSTSGGKTFHVGSTDSISAAGNGFSIYDATAAAPRFLVNPSGNVGIGTSSPAAKLHVNSGNIEVSNFNVRKNRYGFHYDQGSDITVYYHHLGRVSYNDGDMHISGSLSGHDSLTQGKAIIDVFINARNAPYINGVVFGNPVNSNIEVYEDASANLNVYLKTATYSQVNLDIAMSGQATSYLTDSTKTTTVPTGTLVANVQDNAMLYVKNSGDVGIGTNNPQEKLEVNGTVKAAALAGPWDQTPNGYLRLGNVQIAWGTTGIIADGANLLITFPAPFISAPAVTITSTYRQEYNCTTGYNGTDSRTSTNMRIYIQSGANNKCSWMAIGPWK